MDDNGSEKNDVKVPDGEVGDKINKLFTEESKDTSMSALRMCATFTNCVADVIILTAMGEQAAIDAKEAPKGS